MQTESVKETAELIKVLVAQWKEDPTSLQRTTEVVKVNPKTQSSTTIHLSTNIDSSLNRDIRGGSQLIPIGDGNYIALTHEVDLFKSKMNRKDATYYHRFIVWDKDWNIINYSDDSSFSDNSFSFTSKVVFSEDIELNLSSISFTIVSFSESSLFNISICNCISEAAFLMAS